MKGHQPEVLRKALNGIPVKLRFWRADDSLQQLKEMATQAEVAIGMVDFMNHSAEDVMKARSPHYIRQNGGVERMIEAVRRAAIS